MPKEPLSIIRSPRRLKHFNDVPPQQRNNSNSIRRLLFDVVVRDFGGSTTAAATRFRRLLHDSQDRRKYRMHGKGLSEWTLKRVALDDTPVNFNQLDALAHHLEMPVGLVLLFTRVRSEVEGDRGDIHEAKKILVAARSALNRLEKLLGSGEAPLPNVYESLSHEQFESVRKAYLDKLEELRETLL